MFSLKPKEGGSSQMPSLSSTMNSGPLKLAAVLALILFLGLGYHSYSTRTTLQGQIDVLERHLEDQAGELKTLNKHATDMGADIDVMTKRLGVTTQELDASRKFAEKLKAEQDKAKEQLA